MYRADSVTGVLHLISSQLLKVELLFLQSYIVMSCIMQVLCIKYIQCSLTHLETNAWIVLLNASFSSGSSSSSSLRQVRAKHARAVSSENNNVYSERKCLGIIPLCVGLFYQVQTQSIMCRLILKCVALFCHTQIYLITCILIIYNLQFYLIMCKFIL